MAKAKIEELVQVVVGVTIVGMLWGISQKPKKSVKIVNSGTFAQGGTWHIKHYPAVDRYMIDVDLGEGIVTMNTTGMMMSFPTLEDAMEAIAKVNSGELNLSPNGSISKSS